MCVCFLFFFMQKTAYDMRISDWSSDVCSSDLAKLGNLYLIRCSTAIDVAADADCIENQITFEGGHDPRWRDHGAVLEWSFGQTYVRSRLSPAACRDANDSCMKALKRSEEHTSELQSLMRISYAVFCLKKKKKQN